MGGSTGTARVTVWESEIGKLEEDGSYRLTGMIVQGKKPAYFKGQVGQ